MNIARHTSEVDSHTWGWAASDDTSLLSSYTAWTCTTWCRIQHQTKTFHHRIS